MSCFSGPLGSALIHRWGNRLTMFVGGIIASSGLFICAFANDIYMVIIAFGVVNGNDLMLKVLFKCKLLAKTYT